MGVHTYTTTQQWPQGTRQKAGLLVAAHGQPKVMAQDYVEWPDAGAGNRVRLRQNGLVEETVPYNMPQERLGQAAVFGGRLAVDLFHREVTAIGDSEEMDHLILNVMHDLVIGTKTRGQAWEKYEWGQQAIAHHWPDPYITGLVFHTDKRYLRMYVKNQQPRPPAPVYSPNWQPYAH